MSRQFLMVATILLTLFLTACTRHILLNPDMTVRAATQVPYTATIELRAVSVESVRSGASQMKDPENYVSGPITLVEVDHDEWEKRIIRYVRTRQTFRDVVLSGNADVGMTLAISVYLDAGSTVGRFVYMAVVECRLADTSSRWSLSYRATGKALGGWHRFTEEADQEGINYAVNQAFRQLFLKIETDGTLHPDENRQ